MSLLFPGQRPLLARSLGDTAFLMNLVQAGIATVGQGFDIRMNMQMTFFEETKIVSLPIRKVGADNAGGCLVDNDL